MKTGRKGKEAVEKHLHIRHSHWRRELYLNILVKIETNDDDEIERKSKE